MTEHDAPRLSVIEVRLFERDVRLRLPFRFGVVTLREAPQAFVRARVRLADGREGWGCSAELMVPKWFDKNPSLSNADNFDQLRRSLFLARDLTLACDAGTAFARHAHMEPEQHRRAGAEGLNDLVAGFGQALLDRAALDALCRLEKASVFRAVRENRVGLDAATAPDLAGFDLERFLGGLAPAASIRARHTVGLADALTPAEVAEPLNDGLPESLEDAIGAYGLRDFKLKVSGDGDADLDRLVRIAAVLDDIGEAYAATLDGNEQFEGAAAVVALWRAIEREPALERLAASIAFVEQPIARGRTFEEPVYDLAALRPVEIDEAGALIDAFPRAKALGYAGISSKSCKGFYASLLNRARVATWNAAEGKGRYFMSAEDLTTQAGIAVQQDLALAALIGCEHVERNGHHYVDGFAGAPEAEQRAFLAAHPDLYHEIDGRARLTIEDGRIALGSLDVPGLGSAAGPDWRAMRAMAPPTGESA